MALSIIVRYTWEFWSIVTSGNTITKLADNECVRWFQQVPDNFQLLSITEKVCSPILPYPMTVRMHIELPHFLVLWLHLPLSIIFPCIFSSSPFPPVCVHLHVFHHNFIQWFACISVLEWYLTLVDYRLLQFHRAIHAVSILYIILYLWD